jgi:hypothetical protein
MHVSPAARICGAGAFNASNSANPLAGYADSDAFGNSEPDSEDGDGSGAHAYAATYIQTGSGTDRGGEDSDLHHRLRQQRLWRLTRVSA